MMAKARDDGAIAILVAALALVLFGFGAIVVDLGTARDLKGQAASSADAAALAGIGEFIDCPKAAWKCRKDARTEVRASVAANFQVTSWVGCEDAPPDLGEPVAWFWRPWWNTGSCIQFGTTPGDTKPTLVFVSLPPRTSPVAFGGIFAFEGAKITNSAVAGRVSNQIHGCALCVLDKLKIDIGNLAVQGGGSLDARRMDFSDSSSGVVSVTPPEAGSFVTDEPDASPGVVFSPAPQVTGEPVVDPFTPPLKPLATGSSRGTAVCPPVTPPPATPPPAPPLPPGIYDDLVVAAGTTCTLEDQGIYEFGGNVTVNGQLIVNGTGATLSLPGTASLVVGAGGSVNISGPAANNPVLYLDLGSITVNGTGTLDVNGRVFVRAGGINSSGRLDVLGDVYLPAGELRVSADATSIIGTAVVDKVRVDGNLNITSDGGAALQPGRPGFALVR